MRRRPENPNVQASAYQLIDLLFEAEGRSDLEQCLIGRTAGSIGASSFFQEASDQYASIIKQETGATKARVDLVLISQDLAWPAGMQADDRHQLPPTCSGVLPQSVPTLILKLCFRELRCPARTGHTQCPWADFRESSEVLLAGWPLVPRRSGALVPRPDLSLESEGREAAGSRKGEQPFQVGRSL